MLVNLIFGEDVTEFGFLSMTREMFVNFLNVYFLIEIYGVLDGVVVEKLVFFDWLSDWRCVGGVEVESEGYIGCFYTNVLVKVDEEFVDVKEELINKVIKLRLLLNFFDVLIDGFGGLIEVVEFMGRSGCIVRRGDRFMYESRGTTAFRKGMSISGDGDVFGVNIVEKNVFMNGDKCVVIILDVVSIGILLYASKGVKNVRRRVYVTIEFLWSVDKVI